MPPASPASSPPPRSLARRVLAVLLFIVVALFLLWLALPRLLGLAAERWLDIPGLEAVRVDIAHVGAGHASLREARAVYHPDGGGRFQIALRDITLDYSLVQRRVERLDIAGGELEVFPATGAPATTWPRLAWPDLPLDAAQIDDLQLTVHRAQLPPLQVRGKFALRQADGQLQAEFWPGADLLRLTASRGQLPGAELDFRAAWIAAGSASDDATADARLQVGDGPAPQTARLALRAPLPLLAQLGQSLGIAVPLNLKHGSVALDAEALLGTLPGSVQTLSGTAEFVDADVLLTPSGRPIDLAFGGKLRFSLKPPLAQVELLPGLHWRAKVEGEQALQANGRLDKTFAVHVEDQGVHNEGELPFTLHSPDWGQWDGVARRLRLKKGSSATDWTAADLDLRVKGQFEKWQGDKLQLRDLRATGDVGFHWSSASGLRSELAFQLGFGKISWSGDSALSVPPSTWKLNATATTKAVDDLWQSLVLQGEASSPQLKVVRGGGQALSLGATRLQLLQVRPANWQDSKASIGELLLSANAVRYGNWPAPDLQARLRREAGVLRADGNLRVPGSEALRFVGSHTLSRQCGEVTLTTRQSLPTLGKIWQPRPAALVALGFTAGDVDARFALDWCLGAKPRFDVKGTAQVRDAVVSWDKARIEAVRTTLQLDGLDPLRGQIQLAARRGELATGTALTDLDVDLALTGVELSVRAFNAKLLGGSVHVEPLRLPWPPGAQTLPLQIRQIDLAELLALAKVNGLSASGRLEGLLPLNYRDGSVEIDNGQLNSQSSGTIKYVPSLTIPDNPGLQALRNFHYEQLGTRLFYAADGAYRIQARLEGNNPDFYNGYPVRFRLNINGQLPGLFRAALFSGDFNRHILEQLQSGKLE